MALNVSALTAYVNQNSKTLMLDTVLESQTAKLLKEKGQFMVGVKGTQAIQTLSTDVSLQVGGCARVAAGNTTLNQKTVTVSPLADYQNLCPNVLETKWAGQYLTQGSTYSEMTFAKEIMESRTNAIGAVNELLIWKGDILNVDPNTNKLDGFVKQAIAAPKVVLATGVTLTTANILDELQKAVLKMTIKVKDQEDARLFIGKDLYDMYLIAIAKEKIFKPVDDFTLYGTSTKMEVVSGLNGSKEVVFSRLSNMVYAIDGLDEDSKARLIFSTETNQFYQDFNYGIGVTFVKGAEVGYAKFV